MTEQPTPEKLYGLDHALALSRDTPLWRSSYRLGRTGAGLALLALALLGLKELLDILGGAL